MTARIQIARGAAADLQARRFRDGLRRDQHHVVRRHASSIEPLKRAWARALQHYGIDVNTDQTAAAQRLLPIIKGDGDESARFTEIFRTTPVWLLQFTGMAMDYV